MANTIKNSVNEFIMFIKNNVSYNKHFNAFELSTLVTGDLWSMMVREHNDVLIDIKNEACKD